MQKPSFWVRLNTWPIILLLAAASVPALAFRPAPRHVRVKIPVRSSYTRVAVLYSSSVLKTAAAFAESKLAVYDSLGLQSAGLSKKAFQLALKGMGKLFATGRINNTHILSIVDFTQPSTSRRMYVIDLDNYVLLYQTFVAHGRKSGKEMASRFSNKYSSHQSSLGFYITGNTYFGNNGYSLRLDGVERGFNDNAMRRAIVVHGADYVNESFAGSQGYIGRSYGCPAVPADISRDLIDNIKEGSCLFIYYPARSYLKKSVMVK